MALVRVLQGPPPGRYGKHTNARTRMCMCTIYKHTFVCHIIQSDVSVYLSLRSWLCLHFLHLHAIRCAAIFERERERWFAVTMWADFWGGLFLSVTQPSNARGPSQQNRDTMESHEPRVRNVPGKNIPEGGWNQNSGKRRKSTCSANEKCTRHPLFTVVSMCICWRSLKPVDYVMLTEQGNDVYCAKQATFSERGVGLPCSQRVVVNSHAQGGTGEVERLTVTGV